MVKILTSLIILLFSSSISSKGIRLKNLVDIKGVRKNPIIGYGLVIGLNGTGDGDSEISKKSLKKMFKKLGIDPKKDVKSKNVASVVVTAQLPEFARIGQKIDIKVSSIADAKSLAGGTLLITPLKGGDGKIYAVAHGSVSLGGLTKGKKFPTTGLIPSGGVIERELPLKFEKKKSIRLSLRIPDFTTSARIEKTLNQELGGKYAKAKDSATIDLMIPANYQQKVVQLMAIIENFTVSQDTKAKIIINERTGTIVAGGSITLKPVAISHGDLTIEIKGGAGGNNKKGNSLYFVDKKTTLQDLVKSLNAFGVGPEDIISIFQALKRNGSLIGEIELI